MEETHMKASRTALNLSERVVFAVDSEMLGALDAAAQRKRISTSAFLRALLSDRLNNAEERDQPARHERDAAPVAVA
jgi:hypothetical protein